MWRSHLDRLSFSEEENRALDRRRSSTPAGEVLLDQRVRRGGSHHQKFVVLRHAGRPGPGRRVRRRDRPVPQPPRRRRARRRPAGGCRCPRPTGRHPPWHDVQLELRGPAVGVLDTVFRERWDDPTSPRLGPPDRLDPRQAARARLQRRPAAAAAAAAAGVRAAPWSRCCAPTRRSGRRYSFAPDGERSVARGYTKAIRRARRLIYLEDQYMWSPDVARLFAEALREQPGAAPRRRRAAAPRPGRRLRAAAEPRSGGGRRSRCAGGPAGTGCTSSTWRTTTGRRSTCTPRSASSTTCGPASAATTSTAGPGPTTASCRAPCSTPRATPASRRPGRHGDGARAFARDLRLELCARAPRPGPRRQRGRRPARPGPVRRGHRGQRRRARGVARRRPARAPAARTAAPAPARAAVAGHPALGDAGLPAARRPRRPPAAEAAQTRVLTGCPAPRPIPPAEALPLLPPVSRGRASADMCMPVGLSTDRRRSHRSEVTPGKISRVGEDFDLCGALRRIRRLADVSQRELAAAASISPAAVAHAEAGTRDLPVASLARAAALAGLRLALLDGAGAEVAGDVRHRCARPERSPVPRSPRHAPQRRGGMALRAPPRSARDLLHLRQGPGTPGRRQTQRGTRDDHHEFHPDDSPADRAEARRREFWRQRAEERERFLAGRAGRSLVDFGCDCPAECDELDDWSGKPVHAEACPCHCDVG